MLAGFLGTAPYLGVGALDGGNGDRSACCTCVRTESPLLLFPSYRLVLEEGEGHDGPCLSPLSGAVLGWDPT